MEKAQDIKKDLNNNNHNKHFIYVSVQKIKFVFNLHAKKYKDYYKMFMINIMIIHYNMETL